MLTGHQQPGAFFDKVASLVGTIGTAGIGMVRGLAVALNPGVFSLSAPTYSVSEGGRWRP